MKKTLLNALFSPWVIGMLIIIPVILPCLHARLFRVHDYTHVARLAELDRTVRGGGIPPRWSENLGFGYGMPLFSFYAPLPYYLGELIHLVGLSFEASVQALFVMVTYFSFMAMYGLARQFYSRAGSLLSATLFVYGPYRAVDTYVRGSLGELFGILFIVVCLYAITRLVKTKHFKWIIVSSLAICGLMLSHNLMALIGLPTVILWTVGLILTNKKTAIRDGFPPIIGILLGLGLSAFFVIPALTEKSFTSVDELTRGGGNFSQHFVYLRQLINSSFGYGGSIEGIYDGISFEIGKIHLALAAIGFLALFRKKRKNMFVTIFALFMIGISIWLMNQRSVFFWQSIPLLAYLQFPWRFLSLILIFSALLGGRIVEFCDDKKRTTWLATGLIVAIMVFYAPLFKPEYYPKTTDQIYSTDPVYVRTEMSKVIPDYIHPRLAGLVLSSQKNIEAADYRFKAVSPYPVALSVDLDTPQAFSLKLRGQGSTTITANIFDFPGWQWWINGQKVDHVVNSPLPTMSLTTTLTLGMDTIVEGRLESTPIRNMSNWISVGSLALIGLILVTRIKKRAS